MIKGLIHFGITERKNEVSVFWRLLRLLQPNIRRKSKVENLRFSPFLIKVFSFGYTEINQAPLLFCDVTS